MESIELHLLSTYLKKWSFNDNRISFNYSFCMGEIYERSRLDTRISSPLNLINELLNSVFYRAREVYYEHQVAKDPDAQPMSNIALVNESEVKQKLNIYISKIVKEFNNNKRNRSGSRMISTRSLDFYYNDFEFEPLDDRIKFYVHLNRGINKTNGDLWPNAIDDFTLAISFRPDNITANRYMALAMRKTGNYEGAIPYLKVCADHDETEESLQALALAYIHLNKFTDAKKIYQQLTKKFPDSLVSILGKAQVAYKTGKKYLTHLDKLFKTDPEWLREKIISEWDYKLPDYADHEENMWNAAIASRYLGFDRPFDLTRKAFNEEIPAYFDPDKGTIRFVKDELDHWVEMANRYTLYSEDYKIYPDKITKAELEKSQIKKKVRKTTKKSNAIKEEAVA